MGATAFLIVICLAVISFAVYQIKIDANNRAQDKAEGIISRLRGSGANPTLRFTDTELIEGYKADSMRHSLSGITARVEDSGTLNRRLTATRLVALGVFALAAPKKQDDREVFLTIEGPTTAIMRTIALKSAGTSTSAAVRKFAIDLNLAVRKNDASLPSATLDHPTEEH